MLEHMVKPGELLDGNCLVPVKGQSLLDDGKICRGGYLHIFTSLYGEHGTLHAGKHGGWVIAQEVTHPRCSQHFHLLIDSQLDLLVWHGRSQRSVKESATEHLGQRLTERLLVRGRWHEQREERTVQLHGCFAYAVRRMGKSGDHLALHEQDAITSQARSRE